jgi:predicted ATP-grasp superfamily ATP-dependent carboligase
MRVFVYEYLSSGAGSPSQELPVSLQREGWAMLSAVLEDLARCPGVQLATLLSPRLLLPSTCPANIACHCVSPRGEEESFRTLAASADWSLVIAPEFDGLLAERSRWVEQAGGRLLGSSLEAIHRAADKLKLSRLWHTLGIPTPRLSRSFPLVCKPRCGAGSQATFLVRNEVELTQALQQAGEEGWQGVLMLQAYAPGLPVSVSFLGANQRLHALPAVEQRLSNDGRFRYLGGRLPLSKDLDYRARQLAERAVLPLEGLHGWFGVDLILGTAVDGRDDRVVEINPRLTTSYVGLRRLACFNLGEALLAVVAGHSLPNVEWRAHPVLFHADGCIEEIAAR